MAVSLNDFYMIMASYIGVIVITVGFFAWQLRGFLGPFLRVKTSRGKKVLVRIRGMVRNHWKVGRIVESVLTYKGIDKQTRKV